MPGYPIVDSATGYPMVDSATGYPLVGTKCCCGSSAGDGGGGCTCTIVTGANTCCYNFISVAVNVTWGGTTCTAADGSVWTWTPFTPMTICVTSCGSGSFLFNIGQLRVDHPDGSFSVGNIHGQLVVVSSGSGCSGGTPNRVDLWVADGGWTIPGSCFGYTCPANGAAPSGVVVTLNGPATFHGVVATCDTHLYEPTGGTLSYTFGMNSTGCP
jgi:hypothetical protein